MTTGSTAAGCSPPRTAPSCTPSASAPCLLAWCAPRRCRRSPCMGCATPTPASPWPRASMRRSSRDGWDMPPWPSPWTSTRTCCPRSMPRRRSSSRRSRGTELVSLRFQRQLPLLTSCPQRGGVLAFEHSERRVDLRRNPPGRRARGIFGTPPKCAGRAGGPLAVQPSSQQESPLVCQRDERLMELAMPVGHTITMTKASASL